MTHKYEELPMGFVLRSLDQVKPGDRIDVNQYTWEFTVDPVFNELRNESLLKKAKELDCKIVTISNQPSGLITIIFAQND